MKHPYEHIADYARWDRAFKAVEPALVDPVVGFSTLLDRESRIVTAGSCFSQHIAHGLRRGGFNYLVTEPGHPLLDDDLRRSFNYGTYSARYGNVYTSRQLLQLLARAYGTFVPNDVAWTGEHGLVDPFRPTIQPRGFPTRQELDADREHHFASVRRAFEQLDVFMFTLGLTECWAARSDGAVFPLAPGVAGGRHDDNRYELVQLGVQDVVADLTEFMSSLRAVNADAKVILTVSPVPMFATAVDRHVLVSNAYSKSVLRVAAEEIARSLPSVHYFPAYEIVTASFSRGEYWADDLRSLRPAAVDHVMRLFFQHATSATGTRSTDDTEERSRAFAASMTELVETLCDEELLLVE